MIARAQFSVLKKGFPFTLGFKWRLPIIVLNVSLSTRGKKDSKIHGNHITSALPGGVNANMHLMG